MEKISFIVCTAVVFGVLLISGSSGRPLKNDDEYVDSKHHATFLYISQLLVDWDMTSCLMLQTNEDVIKNVFKYYFSEMRLSSEQCKNISKASLHAKDVLLNLFHLEKYRESEVIKILWEPVEELLEQWCTSGNFPLNVLFAKLNSKPWNDILVKKLSKSYKKIFQFLNDFLEFAFPKQEESTSQIKIDQPLNESTKEMNFNVSSLFVNILDFQLKFCSFLQSHKESAKDMYMAFFHDMLDFTLDTCQAYNETILKDAVMATIQLPESLKNDAMTLIWTPFDAVFKLWCEIINNDSVSLDQIWKKMDLSSINWESILRLVTSYMDKLKVLPLFH